MIRERPTPQQARERIAAGDKNAALAWLELVGSWPSSDPEIGEVTDAAERLLWGGKRRHG